MKSFKAHQESPTRVPTPNPLALAAARIIAALTLGDHFAVVAFSDSVHWETGPTLQV